MMEEEFSQDPSNDTQEFGDIDTFLNMYNHWQLEAYPVLFYFTIGVFSLLDYFFVVVGFALCANPFCCRKHVGPSYDPRWNLGVKHKKVIFQNLTDSF